MNMLQLFYVRARNGGNDAAHDGDNATAVILFDLTESLRLEMKDLGVEVPGERKCPRCEAGALVEDHDEHGDNIIVSEYCPTCNFREVVDEIGKALPLAAGHM